MLKSLLYKVVLFISVLNILQVDAYAQNKVRIYSRGKVKKILIPNYETPFDERKSALRTAASYGYVAAKGAVFLSPVPITALASTGALTSLGTTISTAVGPGLATAAAAVGGTAALTGIGAAAIVGAALVAYGSYKTYKHYQSKLMAVSSEEMLQIHDQAEIESKRRNVNFKDIYKTRTREYIEAKLNQFCTMHGFPNGVDMKHTKVQRRHSNLSNSLSKDRYLTAFDLEVNETQYSYVKGFDQIVVDRVECREGRAKPDQKFMMNFWAQYSSSRDSAGEQDLSREISSTSLGSTTPTSDRSGLAIASTRVLKNTMDHVGSRSSSPTSKALSVIAAGL